MNTETTSPPSGLASPSCSVSLPVPFYDRDGITIYHGDCLEIMPLLTERFDICFTSPPYNKGKQSGAYANMRNAYESWSDDLEHDEYREWQHLCVKEMARVSDAVFYNHKPQIKEGSVLLPTVFIPSSCNLRQVIVWDRGGGFNHSPGQFVPACEWIMLLAAKEWTMPTRGSGSAGDVWRVKIAADKTGHPCAFPLELVSTAINATGAKSILDPFGGSGTTARAAKDLGLRAVIIEKEAKYCAMAVDRLAQDVFNFSPQNASNPSTP